MSLVAENFAVGYGAHRVASGIDLSLQPGEVLCLLGPNGGGKTTLFKTMLGLLPALGGRVSLEGRSLTDWPRRDIAQRIAYVPQAHSPLFPFQVLDMATMGRTAHLGLFALPSRQDREIAGRSLGTLGIGGLASRVFTDLSGGERQLVLIARALAQEAPILVMDEPTASLDFGNQVRVLQRIRSLTALGKSVILSTHDPDHAFLCADRVALLHGGRLLALGSAVETMTAENLSLLYGVDVRIAVLPEDGRRVCLPVVV